MPTVPPAPAGAYGDAHLLPTDNRQTSSQTRFTAGILPVAGPRGPAVGEKSRHKARTGHQHGQVEVLKASREGCGNGDAEVGPAFGHAAPHALVMSAL